MRSGALAFPAKAFVLSASPLAMHLYPSPNHAPNSMKLNSIRLAYRSLALILAATFSATAGAPAETTEEHNARMAWWREAKFGMFIHWGVYAVPAGFYKGKPVAGIGEWIMKNGSIPVAKYKAYAPQFTAARYNPDAWAALAKRAGMRYLVITSKHHDGFSLFDSAVSDWDAVDASGARRDLIAPLAAATRSHGLKFGLYYSQAQDWVHPGGAKSGLKEGESWDEANKGSFDHYLDTIAVPQVKEILTRFQPDVLWWDTPNWMNPKRAERFIPHLALVPGIIHNNRLGGGYKGDTETPEQHIPARGFKDRDWEVCMTMNDTWGFKSDDHNWKSVATLIQQLCDIASKGGNFLLNVGPTADGEIPAPSIERLNAIGRWMDVNQESIYGTIASPFHRLPWGRCTRKTTATGTTLYLQVFDWPADASLRVPGLRSKVFSCTLLAGGSPLEISQDASGTTIRLPQTAPDPAASVIKLEIAGPLEVDGISLTQNDTGLLTFTPHWADLHNQGYGTHVEIQHHDSQPHLGQWSDPQAWVEWSFRARFAGSFTVTADVAAAEATSAMAGLSGQLAEVKIPATGRAMDFQTVSLGKVTIAAPGDHRYAIKPVGKKWKPVVLRSVTLTPIP